ncbi:unnamed protein product [Phytophthora fragariaefolia]|uniref:Unnamed protein product n=1 Tax=Phytophthora fragariaefolia TaxID=1490495 RepID=A0A9W6U8D6_9STRA|nr:unnamed protein product [Phytophthora fragariaefolia]
MPEKDLLLKIVLVWVDDLLIYASTINEFLEVIDLIYSLLEEYGLLLGMDKTCLYTTSEKWCGCVLTKAGVAYDSDKIRALVEMPAPTTSGVLQQYLCAVGWIRKCLLDFARICKPLQDRPNKELSGTRRTKKIAGNIVIELMSEELDTFNNVKDLLRNVTTLALPDPDAIICMYSDASDEAWSIILTMVTNWSKTAAAAELSHNHLHCMSGIFRGASSNWSVIENEGYLIARACSELDYLLIRDKSFKMFTVHQNLIYIFAAGTEIKKHVRGKLLRWSLKLNEFKYEIEHIPGDENVWADMFSRWAGQKPAVAQMTSL